MLSNMPTIHAPTAPRLDRREQAEAQQREARRAAMAAQAEQAIKAEEQARFDEKARAAPSELFADDPEIKALTADHEVKKRQRPALALANPQLVQNAAEKLRASIKAATLEAVIAAIEDLTDGDQTLRRAMAFRQQIDDDTRKLDLLLIAHERVSRGFGQMAREREQQAHHALESALMERKRQYLRERPEGASRPASEPQPTASDVVEV